MGDGERFVAEHTELVRKIAFAIAEENGLRTDVDDLIGWGLEGLLVARERFDASKGVPFEAFARYRIRGAILDGIRLLSDLPPQVLRLSRQAALADAHLEDIVTERAASGEPLDDDGLMLARSLDAILSQLTMASVAAAGADPVRGGTPEDNLLSELERRRVRKAVSLLPPRESRVVSAVYFEDLALDDLGRELSLSRSAVSRIHTKGLELLREARMTHPDHARRLSCTTDVVRHG